MSTLSTHIESCRRNEDRLVVDSVGDRTLLVVADGAGGTINGRAAAQRICSTIQERFRQSNAVDWTTELRLLDTSIARSSMGGCSTVVVVEIVGSTLVGASVGDSEAWMLAAGQLRDLTAHQVLKPLLGTGHAVPIAFGPLPVDGRVLVATDGLFKYAKPSHIIQIATTGPVERAVSALADGVRLRDGSLQDDVAIVLYDASTEGLAGEASAPPG